MVWERQWSSQREKRTQQRWLKREDLIQTSWWRWLGQGCGADAEMIRRVTKQSLSEITYIGKSFSSAQFEIASFRSWKLSKTRMTSFDSEAPMLSASFRRLTRSSIDWPGMLEIWPATNRDEKIFLSRQECAENGLKRGCVLHWWEKIVRIQRSHQYRRKSYQIHSRSTDSKTVQKANMITWVNELRWLTP